MRHIFLGILLPLLTVILTKVCKAWPTESAYSQSTCNLSAALIGAESADRQSTCNLSAALIGAEYVDRQSTCNLSAALIGGSVLDGFFFFFYWLAVSFLFAPSISLLLSRQSICAARQRYGGVDRINWTHGKCKGLIPYARGGGGAAGGSGADFFFFFYPDGGAIHAATAGL